MSTATIEEFQRNTATFLAAVEHGEQFIIARDHKPVARLLPIEEGGPAEAEQEAWLQAALRNLARAYGPDEPEYSAAMIVEPNPYYRPYRFRSRPSWAASAQFRRSATIGF